MTRHLFSKVICTPQSGSTNDDAFAMLAQIPSCLVWTTNQTAGRGSKGRSWLSPPGQHLALTMAFDAAGFPSPGECCYPLLAGVAAYDSLHQCAPDAPLSLKWPNDILLDGKKLAGILCESRWIRNQVYIAVGIGINLKEHPNLTDLPKGYASLASLKSPPSPAAIVEALQTCFPKTLAAYTSAAPLNQSWLQRSAHQVGAQLHIKAGGQTLQGVFTGLDGDGALMLCDDHNHTHRIAQSCEDFMILPTTPNELE